jgi:YfiH family protein
VTGGREVHIDTELVLEREDVRVPALVHAGWEARFPWLVQGTTVQGQGDGFDLGLFAHGSPAHVVHENWNRLMAATDMERAVLARQVHGAEVRLHRAVEPGLSVVEACDGHATPEPGVLIAVTVADCVPVFLVAPSARVVAVLHAGWRGVAAGVLEQGLSVVIAEARGEPSDVHVHLGPSICGGCYEVGREVFEALSQPVPDGPTPIDLRAVLAARAAAAGVSATRISVSTHCTSCTASRLFSHRGGDAARQVGYLGIRA